MSDTPDMPDASAPNREAKVAQAGVAKTLSGPRVELRPELKQWCETWKDSFEKVIAQLSGSGASATFEISPEPLAKADSDVWYTITAGGATRGEMTLHLSGASGTRLAKKLLGEPAEPETPETAAASITSDNKEALEEFLRQIAGLTCTALAPLAGGEVQLHLTPSNAPSWSSDAVVCLQSRDETGALVAIEIQISAALAAALVSLPAAVPVASAPSTPPASSDVAPNYRLLMDVDLDVKLRFGSRRMQLRDILALSAGVVVELDNALQSPVDLLLDGRTIASGEVVIVDGKYGLRVTSVPGPV